MTKLSAAASLTATRREMENPIAYLVHMAVQKLLLIRRPGASFWTSCSRDELYDAARLRPIANSSTRTPTTVLPQDRDLSTTLTALGVRPVSVQRISAVCDLANSGERQPAYLSGWAVPMSGYALPLIVEFALSARCRQRLSSRSTATRRHERG
jgi:hypothetical protein